MQSCTDTYSTFILIQNSGKWCDSPRWWRIFVDEETRVCEEHAADLRADNQQGLVGRAGAGPAKRAIWRRIVLVDSRSNAGRCCLLQAVDSILSFLWRSRLRYWGWISRSWAQLSATTWYDWHDDIFIHCLCMSTSFILQQYNTRHDWTLACTIKTDRLYTIC